MSETVFVFGAGASVGCGAPVMANFLDVARQIHLSDEAGLSAPHFASVFRAIAALNDVYAKATIDTDNLEAVFAAFEMAQLFGRLKKFNDQAALAGLTESIRGLIVETLEQTVFFHVSSRQGDEIYIDGPPGYGHLVALLGQKTPPDLSRYSFITFNYDLALDFTFRWRDIPIDYGLKSEVRPSKRHALLLKLHGSINWTECRNCDVGVYDLGAHIVSVRQAAPPLVPDRRGVCLRVAEHLATFDHCNDSSKGSGVPLLVPPTWSKAEHHRRIERVWRRAAEELSTARNIIVIGYSLPETDAFFRYLYALGTVSDTRIERFWLVDPDNSGKAAAQFRALLGPTVANRFRLIKMPFENAVDQNGDLNSFLSLQGKNN